MTDMDDTDLPARMAAQDESALAELYDRFGARVFALVLRVVGNPRDAEEVVQDAFVTAWKNAARYESHRASPLTWIVTIARNKAIDRLRSTGRRIPGPPAEDRVHAEAVVESTAADAAEIDDRAEVVIGSVRDLPPNQRQAIELAFFEGLTHPEIAARLGESIGTVKSRIRLGMAKLRTKLKTALR